MKRRIISLLLSLCITVSSTSLYTFAAVDELLMNKSEEINEDEQEEITTYIYM